MATVASRLIYLTMDTMADYLLGDDDAGRAEEVLGHLFRARGNMFSHEFADVVLKTGEVAGLVMTFPARKMRSLELPTAYRLTRAAGISGLMRMIVRSQPLAGVKEAEDDEYFIPHLAVLPQFEGQGLGRSLLAHAESKAKTAGFRKIALTVEVDNQRAISLYARAGFRVISTAQFGILRRRIGYPGFHQMTKTLA